MRIENLRKNSILSFSFYIISHQLDLVQLNKFCESELDSEKRSDMFSRVPIHFQDMMNHINMHGLKYSLSLHEKECEEQNNLLKNELRNQCLLMSCFPEVRKEKKRKEENRREQKREQKRRRE